jgi:hypothetical protein
VWLAVLTLAVSCRTRAAEPKLATGDLVFETSSSAQSAAVQWATSSPWSHVGIVEVSRDGTFVIEALGRVTRRGTPGGAARGMAATCSSSGPARSARHYGAPLR